MTLPIDRTALTAAAVNQVPSALIRSALNIAAITTPYNAIDELFAYVVSTYNTDKFTPLGIINVKDSAYGAKGDGVTDDTAALRAALGSVGPYPYTIFTANTGRIIYVPAGTYIISDTLYLRKGDILVGAGGTASIFKSSASFTGLVLRMAYGLIGGVETLDPGGLCTQVEGIFFAGNNTGIKAGDSGTRILDCWFTCNIGIIIIGPSGGAIADVIIRGCINDNGQNFLKIYGTGNEYDTTHSVIVDGCGVYAPTYSAIELIGVGNVKISNTYFNYCKFFGIFTEGALTNYRLQLDNCSFLTSESSSYYDASHRHIYLAAPCKDFIISNCQFNRGVQADIYINNADIDNLKIMGCKFADTFDVSIRAPYGTNKKITDCEWKDTGGYPIDSTSHLMVSNCTFLNPFTAGIPADDYDKGCIRIQQAASGGSVISDCRTDSSSVAVVAIRTDSIKNYSYRNKSGWTWDSHFYTDNQQTSIDERSTQPPGEDRVIKGFFGTSRVFSSTSAPLSAPDAGDEYKLGDVIENKSASYLGSVGTMYQLYGWRCVDPAVQPGTWVELRIPTGN